MSVSFITNENQYTLHGAAISLSGLDQAGNLTAPIITNSNVLCANLYVARAVTADNGGGGITANSLVDGWLATTSNVTVGTDLQVGGNATITGALTVSGMINGSITNATNAVTSNVSDALATTGSPVNVSSGAPGTAGQVLTLSSPTSALWQTPSGGGLLTQVKVTLSSSEIKGMYASPVTVLPAQGPGTIIQMVGYTFNYKYGTTPYAGGGTGLGPYIRVSPSGYLYAAYVTIFTTYFKETQGYFSVSGGYQVFGGATFNSNTIADITNKPLVITNDVSPFTGGDGTIDLYMTYEVVTL